MIGNTGTKRLAFVDTAARTTIFVLSESVYKNYDYVHKVSLLKVEGALNKYVDVKGHISLKDTASVEPPEFLPEEIESAFREGATCLAVGCYNAAGTMFRLCIDRATRSMLPSEDMPGLNSKVRRDLGLRLPWLFENGLLPGGLKELSSCIKEDGNDGAHAGNLSGSGCRRPAGLFCSAARADIYRTRTSPISERAARC